MWHHEHGGGEKGKKGFKMPFCVNVNGTTLPDNGPPLLTFYNQSMLFLPDGKTATFSHNRNTRLPLLHCFKDALASSKTLALTCVSDEQNQNLTSLQKALLQWHFQLGHMGFKWIQWLGQSGILGPPGERWGKSTVMPPKCTACQYVKQQRSPRPGQTTTADE